MLTDREGYRILDQCIDNNVLSFDGSAPKGVFTKHLVYIIKRQKPEITHLLIPEDVFVDFISPEWESWENLKCFGINIIYDERLKVGQVDRYEEVCTNCGVWFDYYIKRGACLAHDDDYLIIGYKEADNIIIDLSKNNIMLGSC